MGYFNGDVKIEQILRARQSAYNSNIAQRYFRETKMNEISNACFTNRVKKKGHADRGAEETSLFHERKKVKSRKEPTDWHRRRASSFLNVLEICRQNFAPRPVKNIGKFWINRRSPSEEVRRNFESNSKQNMAPIQRRPHTRSHHKKLVRRSPNISELVYKFLRFDQDKENGKRLLRGSVSKCSFCKRQERREQVLDSVDSLPDKNMANKRKESVRNSKTHRVKRLPTSKDHTLSASMRKGHGGEGLREMKRYIQKAIDFGVESGYLIPKDASYKVLRVSSGLLNDVNYASKVQKSDGRTSHTRQTPSRLDEYEVQDARRRRRSGRRRSRKRRRSRSRSRRRRKSRRRGRRRSGSGTTEEVIDLENDNGNENDDNESEFEAPAEKRSAAENANRNETAEQPNQSDREKASDKAGDDDGSDLSMDEEETDDDEGKKGKDANKS